MWAKRSCHLLLTIHGRICELASRESRYSLDGFRSNVSMKRLEILRGRQHSSHF